MLILGLLLSTMDQLSHLKEQNHNLNINFLATMRKRILSLIWMSETLMSIKKEKKLHLTLNQAHLNTNRKLFTLPSTESPINLF